jgi:prophage regulatory protein
MIETLCLGIVVTLGIAMLFNHGEIEMRILSKRQLRELVLYSPQHVARLEKAGTFPKRIQLGPNRVGWVEDEVLNWLQERLDRREDLTDTPV